MARTLTLSDGASALAAEGVAGFDALWQGNALVFRAHAARFARNHDAIHGVVAAVDVHPRIARVGRTSFQFACTVTAADGGALLAETRGTFVHVDPATGKSRPYPDAVAAGLRARADDDADDDWLAAAFDGTADPGADAAADADAAEWATRVRRSDTDLLDHVNNARWAHFAMDARDHFRTPAADVVAIAVDYLAQVRPGETVTCRDGRVRDVADRTVRRFDFCHDGRPCTVVRLLERAPPRGA